MRRPTAPDVSRCLARSLVAGLVLLVGLTAAGEQGRNGASGRKTALVSETPLAAESALSPKLDSLLRRLVRDHSNRMPLAWALPSEQDRPLIRTEALPDGRLAAGVLIHSANIENTKSAVTSRGGYVRAEAGDVVVAVLPVEALGSLADL
ncbi:MAG: hypothetical protein NEA02_13730, partial [Thermoanaerobaculia bacterium]|nr:hypothetical protein [Thermoanaerobaculia bacterium]